MSVVIKCDGCGKEAPMVFHPEGRGVGMSLDPRDPKVLEAVKRLNERYYSPHYPCKNIAWDGRKWIIRRLLIRVEGERVMEDGARDVTPEQIIAMAKEQ